MLGHGGVVAFILAPFGGSGAIHTHPYPFEISSVDHQTGCRRVPSYLPAIIVVIDKLPDHPPPGDVGATNIDPQSIAISYQSGFWPSLTMSRSVSMELLKTAPARAAPKCNVLLHMLAVNSSEKRPERATFLWQRTRSWQWR